MVRRAAFLFSLPILALACMAQSKPQPQQQSSAAAAQPQAPAAALSPDRARFAFGGNAAEIPATFSDHIPFLPVTLNGSAPSLFVLDTTAKSTSISPARAAELGISANQPVGLILPGVGFPFSALPQLARDTLGTDLGRQYEGTLGADVLSRAVVVIDYARETVRIYDPSTYKYQGHGSVMPLSFHNAMPVIHAKFSTPKGKQVEADFGVNTALIAGIVFSRKFSDARHVFPTKGKIAQAYDPQLTGGENVSLFRLRYFKIAGSAAESPIAELSSSTEADGGDTKLAGVIGAGFLQRFDIVFDYPHKQIIFDVNANFKNYDEEDKSGIALVASGPGLKTLQVVHVAPNSPAGRAGIKTGDVIAGIDDEPAANISLASAREMFRDVGHKYKLLVQRGDQTREVTIQTERLL
ncbi:MAG TPA: PDZ domain-containing protein [Candidatus Acidoferrales bacterium]|nr:PDZ domain-containing protein [Candidatus Acidoferrales bacterium]